MDRNLQKIGWINGVTLVLVGLATQAMAQYSNAATAQIGVVFLALGALVAAVSGFQMRLAAREQNEQLEWDELKKAPDQAALFAPQEAEAFPARHARLQFERIWVPVFTVLLFLLEVGGVIWLWPWVAQVQPPPVAPATLTMALMALFALIFFLLGKYSNGLARLEGQRLLEPGASYLLLGSVIGVLTALVEAAVWFGFPQVDRTVAQILTVLLGLVAIETLFGLVFEIYRPRVKGQARRLLYQSRLVGLLGQPGGLIHTAAQAFDYQFGFKISGTWVYQYLEKAFAWILLGQVLVLLASTTLVLIEPQEQALLERFGQPVPGRDVLEPGLHFTCPWPIDRVYRYNTRGVQTFYIGFIPDPEREKEKTLLWTVPHYKEEFNLLVASRNAGPADPNASSDKAIPVNLISVNIPVQYRIRDLRAWAYHYTDAGQLLEALANREVVRYLVNVDMDDLMGPGRTAAGDQLRQRIQAQADGKGLGVEILFVGLQGIHPPVLVAKAYQDVVGAMQEKETNILAARAYRAEKIPLAQIEATNLVSQAVREAFSKVTLAAAEASQFTNQQLAYRASPGVYLQRSYLETLARAIAPARKYVLAATNTQDVIWLNLEDKIREDMLDVVVPK